MTEYDLKGILSEGVKEWMMEYDPAVVFSKRLMVDINHFAGVFSYSLLSLASWR
jgi:hypothetical protein